MLGTQGRRIVLLSCVKDQCVAYQHGVHTVFIRLSKSGGLRTLACLKRMASKATQQTLAAVT